MRKKPTPAGFTISNCTITGNATSVNEHTRAAVIALADALKENATALGKAADVLKSAPGIETGIYVGNQS